MKLNQPIESQQVNLMKLSPRLIATNPVNGMVVINVPQHFYMFASQLLNTLGKRSDYFASCISCKHFNENRCTLYNAVPPPEVIANGCDSYEDREYIPF
jgi:hypothetical protein